ncbi:3-deoxy-7-phosphoheptulonate synthase [Escherichia coli]|uniref:Phospho-2-dehydro-3-deoxyheptonate aldolase n=1 Tax=Proteus faecis TaxID=2050967 RepID=A0AAW7CWJ4_9GAMM|nr:MULTISPECIES: 3-deoxy-7-phosphoheptulonate synthase [Enterobacterales]EFN7274937.1 3-deoxy-7-phosphoheptulonate synthase [Escherichia coli O7:H7]APL04595.1 phospho-2-dehydro-3-deoxyheptonate aldolase [Escherichia coli]APL14378.1 phospho-2-dehydro-3-deoxyheptonate aldolase [Escherichia coli]APL21377.1 phospho-2-dehydro-3-deoxyheptonate aldolase [Escherichia coli]APL27099.1 phospho-2-dehydro-3-deoxyheptonate aldolase [Escherichia coli]
MYKIDELRIDNLVTPDKLAAKLPASADIINNVIGTRERIGRILNGEDKRLLVVIGPCSIHDRDAAQEYAGLLAIQRELYKDRLEIVMRTYFEKPRTVVGWKGLISDPALDGSYQVNRGIETARQLLLDINQLGLPTATEYLDVLVWRYIADLISWGAIGARTTESQVHREMASALSCPIGFKNGTDGNVAIAIDAIRSARNRHTFFSQDQHGRMAVYQTKGNAHGHIVLRGGKKANYHAADIAAVCGRLHAYNLPVYLMIDFSHSNSQKIARNQLMVATEVCRQISMGEKAIAGVMVESFLIEGSQSAISGQALTYGQSITDPCLSWMDSVQLLSMLAEAVDSRFSQS